MIVLQFIGFLALGIAITWLLQEAGPLQPLWNLRPWLYDLANCDLCLGFWVFLAMAALLQEPVFGLWPFWVEVLLAGLFCAVMGHLLRAGWSAKFGVVIIN